jgi:hypothetical protein
MDFGKFLSRLDETSMNTFIGEAIDSKLIGEEASSLMTAPGWKYWPEKSYGGKDMRVVVREVTEDEWEIYSLSRTPPKGASAGGAMSRLAKRSAMEDDLENESTSFSGSRLDEAAGNQNEGKPEAASGWFIVTASTFDFAKCLEECIKIVQGEESETKMAFMQMK